MRAWVKSQPGRFVSGSSKSLTSPSHGEFKARVRSCYVRIHRPVLRGPPHRRVLDGKNEFECSTTLPYLSIAAKLIG